MDRFKFLGVLLLAPALFPLSSCGGQREFGHADGGGGVASAGRAGFGGSLTSASGSANTASSGGGMVGAGMGASAGRGTNDGSSGGTGVNGGVGGSDTLSESAGARTTNGGTANGGTGGTANGGTASNPCAADEKSCASACVKLNDPKYGCGPTSCSPCALPNVASAKCDSGACAVNQCFAGYGDCTASAGCETDLRVTAHCGSCNTACQGATNVCAPSGGSYACASTCIGTQTACTDQCAETSSDPTNCGSCGKICPAPTSGNGTANCQSSTCGITCSANFHECGTSCKADNDATACGASCITCAGATPSCVNGSCQCTDTVCGSACIDTTSNAANCGACGHSCLGGTCQGGACKPFTVVAGQSSVNAIYLDNTSIYWAVELGQGPVDAIRRAPLLGNADKSAQDLSTIADNVYRITGNSTALYWGNWGSTQSVLTVPKAGGMTTVFAANDDGPSNVSLNASNVFWAQGSSNGGVVRKPLTSGAIVKLTPTYDTPETLAIDGSNAYFDTGGATASIMKVPLTATAGNPAPVGFAFDQNYPKKMALDSNYVYWLTSDTKPFVRKVPIAGGTTTTLYSSAAYLGDLAIDGNYAYFTTGTSLMRVPLAGGAAVTLATGVGGSGWGLAVNDTAIYFAGSSTILALAK